MGLKNPEKCNKHIYIASYTYNFERMLHWNILYKNVYYFNNKHTAALVQFAICGTEIYLEMFKKKKRGKREYWIDNLMTLMTKHSWV